MLYLDHNATTPLHESVVAAMEPFLTRFYGNPSSLYRLGRLSRDAVERARAQVAALVGASPAQVLFTSGGTEANNLLLKGLASALAGRGLAVGAAEHPSVLEAAQALARQGIPLTLIGSDGQGRYARTAVEQLPAATGLVSLMWANNETGVVQDIAALAAGLRERGCWLHSDAVQAVGKVPVDFARSGLHALSLSSHKIYGPKGAGALIAERALPLQPLLHGGGQERDLRSGTENVAAIVGFGQAAELARQELAQRAEQASALRNRLEAALSAWPGATLFAQQAERLPNTLQFSLAGMDGEALVMALDRQGVALSSGSACASGAAQPSHVLLAMGIAPDIARGAVRVSFGAGNRQEDVDLFLAALQRVVDANRER